MMREIPEVMLVAAPEIRRIPVCCELEVTFKVTNRPGKIISFITRKFRHSDDKTVDFIRTPFVRPFQRELSYEERVDKPCDNPTSNGNGAVQFVSMVEFCFPARPALHEALFQRSHVRRRTARSWQKSCFGELYVESELRSLGVLCW